VVRGRKKRGRISVAAEERERPWKKRKGNTFPPLANLKTMGLR